MRRFASPPRPRHPRRHASRSRNRSSGFYSPLDFFSDAASLFIEEGLDTFRYAAETIADHSFYFAGRQARRLGRKLMRRFGER